jgi:transcriptional regulator with GAF, ATPase, and Fis domain
MLEFLMGVNNAAGAAIFTMEPEPRLFVGRGIGQEALDWTCDRWQQEREQLAKGKFSRSDDCILVPVMRGEHAVALLYLKASELDMDSLAEVVGLIADAVVKSTREAAPSSLVAAYLEQTTTEEIQRRKLLILLEHFEWNVARVARELKVTRTTVYKRLAEWRIPRKRVPKDSRSPRYAPTLR